MTDIFNVSSDDKKSNEKSKFSQFLVNFNKKIDKSCIARFVNECDIFTENTNNNDKNVQPFAKMAGIKDDENQFHVLLLLIYHSFYMGAEIAEQSNEGNIVLKALKEIVQILYASALHVRNRTHNVDDLQIVISPFVAGIMFPAAELMQKFENRYYDSSDVEYITYEDTGNVIVPNYMTNATVSNNKYTSILDADNVISENEQLKGDLSKEKIAHSNTMNVNKSQMSKFKKEYAEILSNNTELYKTNQFIQDKLNEAYETIRSLQHTVTNNKIVIESMKVEIETLNEEQKDDKKDHSNVIYMQAELFRQNCELKKKNEKYKLELEQLRKQLSSTNQANQQTLTISQDKANADKVPVMTSQTDKVPVMTVSPVSSDSLVLTPTRASWADMDDAADNDSASNTKATTNTTTVTSTISNVKEISAARNSPKEAVKWNNSVKLLFNTSSPSVIPKPVTIMTPTALVNASAPVITADSVIEEEEKKPRRKRGGRRKRQYNDYNSETVENSSTAIPFEQDYKHNIDKIGKNTCISYFIRGLTPSYYFRNGCNEDGTPIGWSNLTDLLHAHDLQKIIGVKPDTNVIACRPNNRSPFVFLFAEKDNYFEFSRCVTFNIVDFRDSKIIFDFNYYNEVSNETVAWFYNNLSKPYDANNYSAEANKNINYSFLNSDYLCNDLKNNRSCLEEFMRVHYHRILADSAVGNFHKTPVYYTRR
jgi:hypothetical protein